MSTLDATIQLTIAELLKHKAPNGNELTVADVLSRRNDIMKFMPWQEANDTFSHVILRALSEISGTFRKLNSGVALEDDQTIQVRETIGILSSYSQADVALVNAAANPGQFRMGRATRKINGMAKTHATKFIYGNSHTTPEEFTGLAPRLNDTDLENVISAGGSGGDTTSLYLVQPGEDACYFIYPKGSPTVGVKHTDKGIQTVDVGTTAGTHSYMEAYIDHFELACGLAVEDNRCIARLANIEVSGVANIFDPNDMIDLISTMRDRGMGCYMLANRKMFAQMTKIASDKSNVLYSVGEAFGRTVTQFMEVPILLVEAIVNTETAVST